MKQVRRAVASLFVPVFYKAATCVITARSWLRKPDVTVVEPEPEPA